MSHFINPVMCIHILQTHTRCVKNKKKDFIRVTVRKLRRFSVKVHNKNIEISIKQKVICLKTTTTTTAGLHV